MRDRTRIISNTLLSYVARAVVAAVGLLLVPFMLTRMGESTYGVIGVVNSILGFVVLVDLGVRTGATRQFTRFLSQGDVERSNELASSSMAAYLAMTVFILAVCVIGGPGFLSSMRVPDELLGEATIVLLMMGAAIGGALLTAPYGSALASKLRYDIPQYTEMGGALIRAVVVVGLFLLWEPRLVAWSAAILLAALMTFAVQRWQARRHCPSLRLSTARVTRRGLGDLASVGIYTSLVRFSMWLSNLSAPLIVSYYLGTAAVAHLSPALMLVTSLEPLSRAFLQQLLPVVTRAHAEHDLARIRNVTLQMSRYTMLASGGVLALIASLSDELIEVWLGTGFEDTALVLAVACATSLLHFAVGTGFPVFVGTGRLKWMALFNTLLAVLGVSLGIWWVGYTDMGVVGAALSMAVTQTLRTIAYFWYVARICELPISRYLRESYLGPVASLAALVAVSFGVQAAMGADSSALARLLVAGAAAGATFSALIWFLGLNGGDREIALDFARVGWNRVRGQ